MRLGRFQLTVVQDTPFRLDGGAMFGVVPRMLWQRRKPPDEQNRIQMTTNCMVLATGDDVVLVDCGIGEKLDPKGYEIYALPEGHERLPAALAAAGYARRRRDARRS